MLKVIREHSRSFLIKGILWMVVISFILTIFLVWGRGSQGLSGSTTAVSTVDGVDISAESFLRLYKLNLDRFQQSISGNIDQQWLQQLAASQALNDLINEEMMVQEAISRGIVVSPEEIIDHITERYEIFQQNGKFIGQEKYLEILRANRISPSEFEEAIRRDLYLQKFSSLIIDGIILSEAELKEEFKRQKEKVSISYLLFQPSTFTDLIVPTDQELAEFYKDNKENYREPERRRITYINIESKMGGEIEVSEREVQRYYQNHLEDFKVPVQRRSRHILFRIPPNATAEEEEAIKKKAEEALSRARAREDFAELAKQYSEDETTAQNGGDLGYSSRGRMVQELDDVLFSMEINDISDVIKTRFGYHIVQLTDIQRAHYQPLSDADIRDRVEKTLRTEKSHQEAKELAEKVYNEASSAHDLNVAGKKYALEVKDSGFFAKEERIEGLGTPTLLLDSAFSLKVGEISEPILIGRSYCVFQLMENKAPSIPPLEEVKPKVINSFKEKGGRELAKRQAEEVRELLLGENPDLMAVASQQKIEPQSPKPFKRGEQIEELGMAPEVEKRAFAMKEGEVSEVVTVDKGFVVFQVNAKEEPTSEEFAQEKEMLKETLLQQKQLGRYSAILTRLRERKRIIYNQTLIDQLMS